MIKKYITDKDVYYWLLENDCIKSEVKLVNKISRSHRKLYNW